MPARSASHRLRIGRWAEPNRIYLLTANTLEREPVFGDYGLGRIVIHQFRAIEKCGIADSLAFVVMPDHFHWLIQLHRGSLGQLMCQVKSLSVRGVNEKSGRTGSLWQQGYHDRALRREENLVKLARYVVANPLRAGLVKRFGDYPLWDAIWV
ncbi:transposase [Pseudomonas sp. Cab53]|uniref:REP-associated tyrosine transposase n=1 Tax=Pseudomonas sp. Cab53 TaxID=2678258 RepID=UPI001BB31FB6|nr:transposase [Pseudomonas sp. Cab53]BBP66414.1 transposase [Pseudomonas sp. Cab53]